MRSPGYRSDTFPKKFRSPRQGAAYREPILVRIYQNPPESYTALPGSISEREVDLSPRADALGYKYIALLTQGFARQSLAFSVGVDCTN